MTERCLQILAIPNNKIPLILDVGCGSGLSGDILSAFNYYWVGMDISKSMLEIAAENGSKGNLIYSDMGQGVPFRAGIFEYAVSVSAIQWLCNAEKSSHNPYKRLKRFFTTLFQSLILGARCCFQFYPENPQQMNIITSSALESGFTGGVVVDYPHSKKAKKYYLFLQAGYTNDTIQDVIKTIPKLGLGNKYTDNNNDEVSIDCKKNNIRNKKKKDLKSNIKKPIFKSKEWIEKMKFRQEKKGKTVRCESKYTGRKRKGHHM